MKRLLAAASIVAASLVGGVRADAWIPPSSCRTEPGIGYSYGYSNCTQGSGRHRVGITCRGGGVTTNRYGPWQPPRTLSWAFCPGGMRTTSLWVVTK